MTTTSAQREAIGKFGERVAASHLVGRGMVVLDSRWRCAEGEIDLVLRDGTVLVVCEVKTRTTTAFGPPVAAVGEPKAERLKRLALRWMDAHDLYPDEVRFDIVGVLRRRHGAPVVEHVRGIF